VRCRWHRAEGIGARTQVGDVAQELQRMPLFLQGIGLRIGRAVDLDLLGLHLDALARSERRHEPSVHTDAGARGDGFELLFAELGKIDHYLDIRNARSVIEGDERHILVSEIIGIFVNSKRTNRSIDKMKDMKSQRIAEILKSGAEDTDIVVKGWVLLFAELGKIDHYLDIRNARSVIEGDERHILVSALGAHPTFDDDVGVLGTRLQNFCDSLRLSYLSFYQCSYSFFSNLQRYLLFAI